MQNIKIKVVLNPPTTTYSLEGIDPKDTPVSYEWSMKLSCGTYKAGKEPTASWTHPEGPAPDGCPHEDNTSHVGTITVKVSDANATATCSYEGSETGIGKECIVETKQTTTAQTSQTNQTEIAATASGSSFWLPSVILILIVAGIASGLYFWRAKKPKRACDKEYADKEAAESALAASRRAFEALDHLKSAAAEADKSYEAAKKEAEQAVRAAGKKWTASGSTDWQGQHIELAREGYQNKETGAKAEAALQKAAAAKANLDAARSAYEASGGDGAWSRAKAKRDAAQKELERAEAALNSCLLAVSTSASSTGSTTGASPGGSVSGSSTGGQNSFVCNTGDKRHDQTESITVTLLDLESIIVKQDKVYSDYGEEAFKFVQYLQDMKDLFNLGKRIKGGISAYFDRSITGAADAIDLPDFLTWYDKGIDELTKSMNRLNAIMQEKKKLGDYWLEYQTKEIILTCRKFEICENNTWVKRCELTVTDENNLRNHRSQVQTVHLIQELNPVLGRLFRQLRNRYEPDKNRAKQFTDRCKL